MEKITEQQIAEYVISQDDYFTDYNGFNTSINDFRPL